MRLGAAGRAAAVAGLLVAGSRPSTIAAEPAIEFSRVPPAAEGGAERMAVIEGRVEGARAGQMLVLYARSGDWFVQPYANEPFTQIGADSTWSSATHLGTEYAALLVDATYIPVAKTPSLPGTGGPVSAVAVTAGTPPWWRTRGFRIACIAAALLAGLGLHRHRVRQLARELDARAEERVAERTRIAQELYDTLLQGFLSASMQLHLAVDDLPKGSPDRARLDGVLRVMGRAIDEGRCVLQGLRSADCDGERRKPSAGRRLQTGEEA
jgi:signal transduction histidine kinase